MKERVQKELLQKLLLQNKNRSRLWAALLALCTGTTLLLFSVMIWWNFQELLSGKGNNDSLGSTFLTVSKKVTDETMGRPGMTSFTQLEINSLKGAPQVEDVGILTSNRFPVYASINSRMGFATEMFVEGVPDRFIDKMPDDWKWTPERSDVPVILSSEFLNLYNYGFALSRGLPQLSPGTIKSLSLNLKVGEGVNINNYTAHVVGFSDRISSVLVPEPFIDYGNRMYGGGIVSQPSRLIIKALDPSDKSFIRYLSDRSYITNAEQLRWSKLRAIVDVVSGATGALAVLLLGIGTLVFILFIELTIARAQQSLTLLLQIGYSPKFLTKFMISRFVPLVLGTVVASSLFAFAAQYGCAAAAKKQLLELSVFPGWPVWLALVISTVILLALVIRAISKEISAN